jgi:hypothetical protein
MLFTKLPALFLALLLALPAPAYDFPLSESSIRDAYYLGTRVATLGPDFLSHYTRTIPELSVGRYISTLTLETPFTQVAVFASKQLNYSAQDAVKQFSGKPLAFRIHMDIIYKIDARPNSVKVKIVQNKKELVPDSEERSLYFPRSDEYSVAPSIGESLQLEFNPRKIDSSTLTIVIDTPDGQHGRARFDLQALR